MKKSKLIGITSLIGVLSLASLIGCGPTVDDNDDDLEVGDGEAYKEVNDENVTEISIFKNDWALFNTAKNQNSPVYQKIKEAIGVDIDAMNTSFEQFENTLSTMQASEELPDIFLTNGEDNSVMFKRFIRNGDILPISNWVSEEHYPNIYHYLQQFNYMRNNISYSNGKLWYIPSTWHLEKSLFIREDWIDNLNEQPKFDNILVDEKIVNNANEITDTIRNQWKFKDPTNLVEFYRLARAFTKYDPDGNGIDDTYGYVSEDNIDFDGWIFCAFDAGWNQYIKQGDSYVHTDIADGSKSAAKFITKMISEGYMAKDSITGSNSDKQNKFINGKTGMMYAHHYFNHFASSMKDVFGYTMDELRYKIRMIEPPAGPNGTHGGPGKGVHWQGFCINRNMSNARIRKCLEFYDWLLSDEGYDLMQYGVEGQHWEWTDATKTERRSLLPLNANGFTTSLEYTDSATMLYALSEWTIHYKSWCETNADIIVPRQYAAEQSSIFEDYPGLVTESYVEYYEPAHKLFEETLAIVKSNDGNLFCQPTDEGTYSAKDSTIETILGVKRTFDSKWNAMVKDYKEKYHGQEYIDDYNAYIASGKATKVEKSSYIFKQKIY